MSPIFFAIAENLDVLVNSTLLSMAATVRTDSDRTVVIATLETLEDMLKGLKGTLFCLADKPMESLAVSLQDIFEQKVIVSFTSIHIAMDM